MRVGFVFFPPTSERETSWLGGLNYHSNLFRALAADGSGIEPVAILPSSGSMPAGFPSLEVVRTSFLDRMTVPWVARMLVRESLQSDVLLSRELRRHRIDVLSHSGPLGAWSSVATVSWIPDFQHRRLPQFFTPAMLRQRDRSYSEAIDRSTLVIVSSEAARRDLATFYPRYAAKARVLRFADCSTDEAREVGLDELRSRYDLPSKFFVLPNQFWVHKNHRTVVRALGLLCRSQRDVVVIATGNTHDPRYPTLFSELIAELDANGGGKAFRPLGVVPFADLAGLLRHAVGVINPSLFEGWSTTVEESKSLGKLVVLSSIDVHREQDPPRALFFSPLDASELAERLWDAWQAYDPAAETQLMAQARRSVSENRVNFSSTFAAIAREAVLVASNR